MTSPPYWSTRDYQIAETTWVDGTKSALGLESDFTVYVDHLCQIFDEVKRVLKPTGTLWVNLGDTYAGSWGNYGACGIKPSRRRPTDGSGRWGRRGYVKTTLRPPSSFKQIVPKKSLCLIPERFAIEMVRRGWILRNHIVWHKPNHMPSSIKDRLTCSWEHLFFFTKSQSYYFDLDSIRAPPKGPKKSGTFSIRSRRRLGNSRNLGARWPPQPGESKAHHPKGKNPADCWDILTRPSRGGHSAGYPEKLCELPIKAGCPKGGVVLDPFMGSGTTAMMARKFGRRFIGFELNQEYVDIAEARLKSGKGVSQGIKGR